MRKQRNRPIHSPPALPKPTAKTVGGEIRFRGRDILQLSERERREIRGGQIGMIFQEPMTSLNPVHRVGR